MSPGEPTGGAARGQFGGALVEEERTLRSCCGTQLQLLSSAGANIAFVMDRQAEEPCGA
jgi:hypothetical protein